jgi:hypothetical protein
MAPAGPAGTLETHQDRHAALGELEHAGDEIEAMLGSVVVHAGLNGDTRSALEWLARWRPERWRKQELAVLVPAGRDRFDTMSTDEIQAALVELERKMAIHGEIVGEVVPPERLN